jgi:hypothetical protein
MTKAPNTCAVLAVQCLRQVKAAPPKKRVAAARRAKVWLTLAKEAENRRGNRPKR